MHKGVDGILDKSKDMLSRSEPKDADQVVDLDSLVTGANTIPDIVVPEPDDDTRSGSSDLAVDVSQTRSLRDDIGLTPSQDTSVLASLDAVLPKEDILGFSDSTAPSDSPSLSEQQSERENLGVSEEDAYIVRSGGVEFEEYDRRDNPSQAQREGEDFIRLERPIRSKSLYDEDPLAGVFTDRDLKDVDRHSDTATGQRPDTGRRLDGPHFRQTSPDAKTGLEHEGMSITSSDIPSLHHSPLNNDPYALSQSTPQNISIMDQDPNKTNDGAIDNIQVFSDGHASGIASHTDQAKTTSDISSEMISALKIAPLDTSSLDGSSSETQSGQSYIETLEQELSKELELAQQMSLDDSSLFTITSGLKDKLEQIDKEIDDLDQSINESLERLRMQMKQ